MLAAPCPRCGAPCSVSLSTPDVVRCSHCGYEGAPSPESRQAVHAAATALQGMDTRQRQLGALQRRSILRSWLFGAIYLAVFGVVSIPFVLIALVVMLSAPSSKLWLEVMLGLGPLALLVVSGLFGVWWLARGRRKLLDSCAAAPPVGPGQPARCHVCGAPLAGSDRDMILRCTFCQADNVVAKDVVARAASRHAAAASSLEHEVRRQASSFGWKSLVVNGVVLTMAFIAPFAAWGGAIVVMLGLSTTELEPDLTARYARWPSPAGDCLGTIRVDGANRLVDFGLPPAPGMSAKVPIAAGAPVTELAPRNLVGLEVIGPNNRVMKVKRVLRTEVDRSVNVLDLASPDGYATTVEVLGTCLPAQPRIGQVAKRKAIFPSDVRDIAAVGSKLALATGDLELVDPARGEATEVSTIYETRRVRVAGSRMATTDAGDDGEDNGAVTRRDAGGGAEAILVRDGVSVAHLEVDEQHVYYQRPAKLHERSLAAPRELATCNTATQELEQRTASFAAWLGYPGSGIPCSRSCC